MRPPLTPDESKAVVFAVGLLLIGVTLAFWLFGGAL